MALAAARSRRHRRHSAPPGHGHGPGTQPRRHLPAAPPHARHFRGGAGARVSAAPPPMSESSVQSGAVPAAQAHCGPAERVAGGARPRPPGAPPPGVPVTRRHPPRPTAQHSRDATASHSPSALIGTAVGGATPQHSIGTPGTVGSAATPGTGTSGAHPAGTRTLGIPGLVSFPVHQEQPNCIPRRRSSAGTDIPPSRTAPEELPQAECLGGCSVQGRGHWDPPEVAEPPLPQQPLCADRVWVGACWGLLGLWGTQPRAQPPHFRCSGQPPHVPDMSIGLNAEPSMSQVGWAGYECPRCGSRSPCARRWSRPRYLRYMAKATKVTSKVRPARQVVAVAVKT